MPAKIRESAAEMALVGTNEFGGRHFDLSRVQRPPETLDLPPDVRRRRALGEEIAGNAWTFERAEAHSKCEVNQGGEIIPAAYNVGKLLRYHPFWRGSLRLNRMRRAKEFRGKSMPSTFHVDVQGWFLHSYWIKIAKQDAWDAIDWACEQDSYHPVELYLGGLKWDGRERIAELPARAGAKPEHAELYRRYFRKFLFAAVKRVLEPGCKFDNMLVLQGEQGLRKSSFIAALAGEWFNDSPIQIDDSMNFDLINAAWIHEFAELETVTSKQDVGRLKAFLTTREDRYRPPYERSFVETKRQSVFAGTTNDLGFLRDKTGSRRFWVVECDRKIDVDWTVANRDQLWAEALALYERFGSENEWLDDDLVGEQSVVNELHEEEDPWLDTIAEHVDGSPVVTIKEVLKHLGVDAARSDMKASRRACDVLRKLGWRKTAKRFGGRLTKCWIPPPTTEKNLIEGKKIEVTEGVNSDDDTLF
jgi:putative DNA primase/helicase